MKYCKKCKHMHNDEEQYCTDCNKPLCEISDENTPVYLCTASGFELSRIRTAIEDNGVPCDAVPKKYGTSFNMMVSDNLTGKEYDLLVPYSAYEKAYDICVGIGAFGDENAEIINGEYNNNENVKSAEEEFEEMSGAKRTTVRIISAALLIALFCLVIWGIDGIMDFIKGLFY